MTQLLQIIRILCNKVLDNKSNNNADIIAKVCLEIHYNQQMNMIQLTNIYSSNHWQIVYENGLMNEISYGLQPVALEDG
ncbi:hypothetical protein BLA29_013354 [Euroglyphus maynei]|uniref:Uncharacterized protein n=1 Tax=Euroglyphus maynei TaxID=6958 RepID=A0A1Y3AT76_EURMA|nr:hypothetical protein BLA29_013354 [Euroglyphus maynei]